MAYVYFLIIFGTLIAVIYSICHNNQSKPKESKRKKEINYQQNDCIIVFYKGEKYDVTHFAKYHPGGREVLTESHGKDIDEIMAENKHSDHAYKLLEKYKAKNS